MDDPADCDPARGHPERTAAPLAVCPPAVLPAPAAGTAMGRDTGVQLRQKVLCQTEHLEVKHY